MRRLLPSADTDVDTEAAYAVVPDTGWLVRASFISSTDGAVSVEGRSAGLGSPADTHVFGLLRDLSDAILVGAGTARTEGYAASRPRGARLDRRRRNGSPDAPVMVLVSDGLEFDIGGGLFPADEPRTVVVTSGASSAERRSALSRHAEVLVCGEAEVDLSQAMEELRTRGVRRVHCEGGPRLFAGMLARGLVDELCLTLAPLLAGPGADRIVTGPPTPSLVGAELRHVLEEDGYLFLRYLLGGR